MPHRTNAFTLQELLIVMILSGILLSTAYYGLRVVQQYHYRFDQRNAVNLQYQTLQSLLQRDVDRATYVMKEGEAIVCYRGNEAIYYEFTHEAVVRKQGGLTEAFTGPAQDMRCYFLKDEVILNHQPISELAFTILSGEERLPFRVHKTYAADQLIQLTSQTWPD